VVVLLHFRIELLTQHRGAVVARAICAPVAREALNQILVHVDDEREVPKGRVERGWRRENLEQEVKGKGKEANKARTLECADQRLSASMLEQVDRAPICSDVKCDVFDGERERRAARQKGRMRWLGLAYVGLLCVCAVGEQVWHVQTVGLIKKARAFCCSSPREGAFRLH
jgi:hypothetical protein